MARVVNSPKPLSRSRFEAGTGFYGALHCGGCQQRSHRAGSGQEWLMGEMFCVRGWHSWLLTVGGFKSFETVLPEQYTRVERVMTES